MPFPVNIFLNHAHKILFQNEENINESKFYIFQQN